MPADSGSTPGDLAHRVSRDPSDDSRIRSRPSTDLGHLTVIEAFVAVVPGVRRRPPRLHLAQRLPHRRR
ncbi:MAG: hypothetical protein K2X97_08185 [Mycobacteriaceae bacterium]|nr:hypothetical protein [Mycobacteriaceae bacterium]